MSHKERIPIMKKIQFNKLLGALLICALIVSVCVPLAIAGAEETSVNPETLFETSIILIQETSVLGDDLISDYTVREADLITKADGEIYWHVSFVKPAQVKGESPRNIVVGLSADGKQLRSISVSPSPAEQVMDRFYKSINEKNRGTFVEWAVEEKYEFVKEWRLIWDTLPKGTLSESGYLYHMISKDFAIPQENDLSEQIAVEIASKALIESNEEIHINDYAIAVSFLRNPKNESIWQIIFITKKMPVIHYHPGYRVDLSSPEGEIIQILDYSLLDDFRYGYE